MALPAPRSRALAGRAEEGQTLSGRVRAWKLTYSLLRWESAAVIGLTTAAVPAAWLAGAAGLLPGWGWTAALALGLVAIHEEHTARRARHEVELVAAVVPLLDDEQRARLEQLLRDGPPRPEGPTREPA